MVKRPSDDGSMPTVSKAGAEGAGGAAMAFEQGLGAGIASKASSSCPAVGLGCATGLPAAEDEGRGEEEVGDAELELGLSLGPKRGAAGNDAPWGEYCWMLTAEDFPSVVASRGSPISSSSSSSSSSPPPSGGRGGERVLGGAAGTKRTADSLAAEVGSHSPSQVVGWPPVRAYRMNSLMIHAKENSTDNNGGSCSYKRGAGHTDDIHYKSVKENTIGMGREKKGLVRSSLFVKVNMDGMAIGRKVDLNSHCSYETLAMALEDMFPQPSSRNHRTRSGKTSKLLDGSSEFVLTYEDKDGDWMLVGDVPWGMFLSTVKRLRIMRTSGANGLATRCQSSKVGGR